VMSSSVFAGLAGAQDLLKVHEWGTFTSFQNERGVSFTHINTDDEPVPWFVHQLFYEGRFAPTNIPPRSVVDRKSNGIAQAHPQVSMRLETPVTYFHLPPSTSEMRLDASVEFHGGWLTEFFPNAKPAVDGKSVVEFKDLKLTNSTVGRLSWNGIRLGGTGV